MLRLYLMDYTVISLTLFQSFNPSDSIQDVYLAVFDVKHFISRKISEDVNTRHAN